MQIESNLKDRVARDDKTHNFYTVQSAPQSDLMRYMFKDPYIYLIRLTFACNPLARTPTGRIPKNPVKTAKKETVLKFFCGLTDC